MPIHVSADNFARAESDLTFAALSAEAGGVNRFVHRRAPTAIDAQPVVRMNRDTLYSFAVVDLRDGAVVTIPDAGERYVSVMVVNQDHYINRVLHDPGEHRLTLAEFDTPYVLVAARVLLDPNDPADVTAVNAIQDRFAVDAGSAVPFELPDYDRASLDATRAALKQLGATMPDASRAFGRRDEVDPVRHVIGAAIGWGGLPTSEAMYDNVSPGLPVGEYALEVPADVPIDAFWSISLYNAEGFFEKNARDAYSVNSITGARNADGSMTVHFGGCGDGRPNCLPIMEGWNYIVRMYRPRPQILDGTWSFPKLPPAG
jgi:hypothetical protein